jgi:hypothetical protein
MDGDGDGDTGALVLNVCTNVSAVTSSTTSTTTYSCNSSAWVPVYGIGGITQGQFDIAAPAIIGVLLLAALYRFIIRFFMNR